MQPLTPFFREAGAGPGIVCLHANASSSNQWRALMELLAPKFRVLAPDSYGAGKSPAWPTSRSVSLRDEAAFLEPVFARAGEPLTLIGHSYGAAIALIAALARPQRVRALALYEPTLLALLDAESPPPNEADGIRAAVERAAAALDAGNLAQAAEHFIDYWMERGAFAGMPEARQSAIAESIVNVRAWANALITEPMPRHAFATLDVPVLYMTGANSPASSRGVARILTNMLPQVEVIEFAGLGHMGPVTHPAVVNDAIAEFVEGI